MRAIGQLAAWFLYGTVGLLIFGFVVGADNVGLIAGSTMGPEIGEAFREGYEAGKNGPPPQADPIHNGPAGLLQGLMFGALVGALVGLICVCVPRLARSHRTTRTPKPEPAPVPEVDTPPEPQTVWANPWPQRARAALEKEVLDTPVSEWVTEGERRAEVEWEKRQT